MVEVNYLKDYADFLLGEGRVQPFEYLLELEDSEVAVSVGVVGVEGLVEGEVFAG